MLIDLRHLGRLALEQFGNVANREVAVSWRAIAVVGMAAAACAGLCGLLPAFVASRANVVDVLSRGVTPAPRELGLRRVFATCVIALACVLLVSLTLDPMRILLRTIGQGAWMVGTGLLVGGVLSIWAARALSSMVFATGRFDPLNIAVAAAVLMVVGVIAVLPAARRAARTDPLSALRSE